MDNKLSQIVSESIDKLGISCEILDCEDKFADTEEFCKQYGFQLVNCGNTILVASKKEPVKYAVCIVRGSDRISVNKTVRKIMGVSRLSFASSEKTVELTGMMIGGVTPFALPEFIEIYLDEKLFELDFVILGSGDRSSKLKISPEELTKLPNSTIVEGLSIPSAGE